MVDREKRINIRVSEDEAVMLAELAEEQGISQSDFVRLFVRRAYEEFLERRQSKKPKPKR